MVGLMKTIHKLADIIRVNGNMTTTVTPHGCRRVPVTYTLEHVYQSCRLSMRSHSPSTVYQSIIEFTLSCFPRCPS